MQWNLWAEQWCLQFVVTKLMSPHPKTSDNVDWNDIYDHRNNNACSSYDCYSDVESRLKPLRNQIDTYVIGPEFWDTAVLVRSLFPFKKIQSMLLVCSFGRGKCWQNKEPLYFLSPSLSGNVVSFVWLCRWRMFSYGDCTKIHTHGILKGFPESSMPHKAWRGHIGYNESRS